METDGMFGQTEASSLVTGSTVSFKATEGLFGSTGELTMGNGSTTRNMEEESTNENENENENVKTKQKMKQGETIQPAMNMMVKEFHRSYHHIDDILYLGIMREVTFGGRCVCK
jgi:hypothetical protein